MPQLPQAALAVRPLTTQLPEMFVSRDGVFGLWQVVRVESRGCEQGKDDGKGLRRVG